MIETKEFEIYLREKFQEVYDNTRVHWNEKRPALDVILDIWNYTHSEPPAELAEDLVATN